MLREDGGTGRRVRLRGVWLHRAGSSPALRTNFKKPSRKTWFFCFLLIAGLSRSDAICFANTLFRHCVPYAPNKWGNID